MSHALCTRKIVKLPTTTVLKGNFDIFFSCPCISVAVAPTFLTVWHSAEERTQRRQKDVIFKGLIRNIILISHPMKCAGGRNVDIFRGRGLPTLFQLLYFSRVLKDVLPEATPLTPWPSLGCCERDEELQGWAAGLRPRFPLQISRILLTLGQVWTWQNGDNSSECPILRQT